MRAPKPKNSRASASRNKAIVPERQRLDEEFRAASARARARALLVPAESLTEERVDHLPKRAIDEMSGWLFRGLELSPDEEFLVAAILHGLNFPYLRAALRPLRAFTGYGEDEFRQWLDRSFPLPEGMVQRVVAGGIDAVPRRAC
jgi:hypothetical protein